MSSESLPKLPAPKISFCRSIGCVTLPVTGSRTSGFDTHTGHWNVGLSPIRTGNTRISVLPATSVTCSFTVSGIGFGDWKYWLVLLGVMHHTRLVVSFVKRPLIEVGVTSTPCVSDEIVRFSRQP